MSITEEYQRALPSAFHALSPQLAALHAIRTKILYREKGTSFPSCFRCGSFILPGDGHVRLQRRSQPAPRTARSIRESGPYSTSQKVLVRKCNACGHEERIKIAEEQASHFPSVRKASRDKKIALAHIGKVEEPLLQHATTRLTAITIPAQSVGIRGAVESTQTQNASRHGMQSSSGASIDSQTASQSSKPIKSRQNKKRLGLQEMLARNKEQKDKEKEQQGTSRTGLADFLLDL